MWKCTIVCTIFYKNNFVDLLFIYLRLVLLQVMGVALSILLAFTETYAPF